MPVIIWQFQILFGSGSVLHRQAKGEKLDAAHLNQLCTDSFRHADSVASDSGYLLSHIDKPPKTVYNKIHNNNKNTTYCISSNKIR
jgi:hypothetical protein